MSQTIEIARDAHVELCRRGDKHAYYEIYRQYAKPMLNSSMRIVNNLADAEDMVQEAFADAFKNIESFTYKSSFEAWLKRIVINKSISFLRKRQTFWAYEDAKTLGADGETYIDEEKFELDILRVKQAIKMLPDHHRVVFNLFVIDEVPQEEIARMLKISHNNVRIIFHRAKRKIIEILKKDQYE